MKPNTLATAFACAALGTVIGQAAPAQAGKRIKMRGELRAAELNAADERTAWNRRVDAERAAKRKAGDARKLAKKGKR